MRRNHGRHPLPATETVPAQRMTTPMENFLSVPNKIQVSPTLKKFLGFILQRRLGKLLLIHLAGQSIDVRSAPSPTVPGDVLLNSYFTRVHGKPYYILDETVTRQRIQMNRIPNHLRFAIYAVSAR
jgi:hypothetical protein